MTVKYILTRLLGKAGYEFKKLPVSRSDKNDLIRLEADVKKFDKIKIHFGSGPRILKGWINIDLSYAHFGPYLQYYTDKHYPEVMRGNRDDLYIIDIFSDGIPLPDESVDIIFHEDFFEHLTQKQQIIFLAETLRVMKKGAVQRINTPNLVASMRDNSSFEKGKTGVYTAEWDNWEHYSVISPAILEDMAKIVGYSKIFFNSKDKSIAAKELPAEYRPDENDRAAADSNVFANLVK
ncbi:class I SAM-dependent methyltransferase [Mucilaginibacter boryungensis]|uniref:Methyltransferase domain-containing protein n=1 Tax=Mucilaginibacter boryungensis TaxID=768480 RepID=A0ABR9XG21_9SPHI|nr:methyltransferase domain-containing protein [Mucilaginibacter boryungensis]MBE9666010.1 methyltransferase domain-containing protein [Mucilaginibacter boryungensis]